MKRILIIGDSLAMPRGEVPYEETWPYFLGKKFPDYEFIDKTRRASKSDRLVNEGGGYKNIKRGADVLEHYNPDVVIVQIGITDCSPRYFRKSSLFSKLLNVSPNFIKSSIYSFIKKYFERKVKYADIDSNIFEKNWRNYIDRAVANNTEIIIISISAVSSEFIKKSPEIEIAIQTYNIILKNLASEFKNVTYIDPIDKNVIEKVAIDELHVNKEGHKIVFEELKKMI